MVIYQNPLQKDKMLSFVYELLGLAATIEFITQGSDFVRSLWDHTKPEIISTYKENYSLYTEVLEKHAIKCSILLL